MGIQVAGQALSLYDLPKNASIRLISLSENEIYQVEGPCGRRWALRVQRPGYQSRNTLASEIAWLAALRRDGVVATPIPVPGLDGEWVQSAVDPVTAEPRNVVLFVWENGCEPAFLPTSSPTSLRDLQSCFRTLGAIIAGMHAHSRAWQRPPGFERFTWNFETALGESPRWGRWRDGLRVDAARIDLFGKTAELIRERLETYGAGPNRFGLVHGDLRLANLLLHEGAVKVIDFDDCGFSWYMSDLATPVSFYEHRPEVPGLMESLLDGYRSVRALSKAEEEEIPTFVMLRRLLLVAWIGSHAETDFARSLGGSYTDQTVGLCVAYLKRFG